MAGNIKQASGAAGAWGSAGDNTRNESVSVGATSVQIMAVNPRVAFSIVNTSTGGQLITVHMGYGTAVAGAGIVLSPGQAWVESNDSAFVCYQGVVQAIASAAGGTVAVFER